MSEHWYWTTVIKKNGLEFLASKTRRWKLARKRLCAEYSNVAPLHDSKHFIVTSRIQLDNIYSYKIMNIKTLTASVVLLLAATTLHKKWSFPLNISSVNVTKSAVFRGFVHIYWRSPSWKTSFFVQCYSKFLSFSQRVYLRKNKFFPWYSFEITQRELVWVSWIINVKCITHSTLPVLFSNRKI